MQLLVQWQKKSSPWYTLYLLLVENTKNLRGLFNFVELMALNYSSLSSE